MGVRRWLACNVTPLLLRGALASACLWSGYSRLAFNDPVRGEEAAILANLGVNYTRPAAAPVTPPVPQESAPEGSPASPPESESAEPDSETPAAPGANARGARGGAVFILARAEAAPAAAAPAPTAPPTTAFSPPAFTAGDFPDPVWVRRLYLLGVTIDRAAHTAEPSQQLWPTQLAGSRSVRIACWLVPCVQLASGAMVLVGFLTRFAALALAGVTLVAMLLTTVGPAAVSGQGFLGFLPPPRLAEPTEWVGAWTPLMLQVSLLAMAAGLVFSGAGGLSLDRLVFGRGERTRAVTASPIKPS